MRNRLRDKFIEKLAVIFKVELYVKHKKYVYITYGYDFEKDKERLLQELSNNKHQCSYLQSKYNELVKEEPELHPLHISFEIIQSLRPSYYPDNVLEPLMSVLYKQILKSTIDEYKAKGKEYLILNEVNNLCLCKMS